MFNVAVSINHTAPRATIIVPALTGPLRSYRVLPNWERLSELLQELRAMSFSLQHSFLGTNLNCNSKDMSVGMVQNA